MSKNTNSAKKTSAIKIKGSMVTLPILQLPCKEIDIIDQELQEAVLKAPKFFQQAPILLDVSNMTLTEQDLLDLPSCLKTIRKHGLMPVGFRGVTSAKLISESQAMGLPMFAGTENITKTISAEENKSQEKSEEVIAPKIQQLFNKTIHGSIRSGQQVHADQGDLVILGSVSAGAEVLAAGNIHVYGNIRGRVLAGIHGDQQARIFCKKLEAELVSIAGHYLISENIPEFKSASKNLIQVFLNADQQLAIEEV